MVCYREVFDAIETEVQHREEERERLEKERAGSLPFDENDGVNMVPHAEEATREEDEDAEEEASEEEVQEEESPDEESSGEDIPGFDEREEAAS